MSLNIKNERTHELVQELAAATGQTQTQAVNTAVAEKLAQLRQRQHGGMADQLLALGREMSVRVGESIEHGELLYDENGLPA